MNRLKRPAAVWVVAVYLLVAAAIALAIIRTRGPDLALYFLVGPVLVAALFYPRSVYLSMVLAASLVSWAVAAAIYHSPSTSLRSILALGTTILVVCELLHRMMAWRSRTEEQLRQATDTMWAIVRSAPLAIIALDRDVRVTMWNPAAERLLGWTEAERLGEPMPILADDRPLRTLGERALRGETVTGVETRLVRKQGLPVEVALSTAPLPGLDGKPSGFLALIADVTERRQLEAQLRHSQKMEAIGRLAGGVAHDFNNLLAVIMGYTEVLLHKRSIEEAAGVQLREIRNASHRASLLTRQLLAFSRRQMVTPQVVDLNEVVLNLEKLLRRLIGEHIELDLELDPDLPPVLADPGQVEQVVMNLAVNSRDAMPEGGRLTIGTRGVEAVPPPPLPPGEGGAGDAAEAPASVPGALAAGEPGVLLFVRDTGCGMDAATLQHIFEPFFTTKDEGQGTGLGLATTYGIVQQCGGWVEADSTPRQGATFRIYLPRTSAAPAVPAEAETAASFQGSETILLVEDEATLRRLARTVLRLRGYTVLEAECAEEAITVSSTHEAPVDLLLTDVVMPGMNGRELAEHLAPSRPEMRVLFISGYTDDEVVRRGVTEAEMAFLQKPFVPTQLLRKVREVLDGANHPSAAPELELEDEEATVPPAR